MSIKFPRQSIPLWHGNSAADSDNFALPNLPASRLGREVPAHPFSFKAGPLRKAEQTWGKFYVADSVNDSDHRVKSIFNRRNRSQLELQGDGKVQGEQILLSRREVRQAHSSHRVNVNCYHDRGVSSMGVSFPSRPIKKPKAPLTHKPFNIRLEQMPMNQPYRRNIPLLPWTGSLDSPKGMLDMTAELE